MGATWFFSSCGGILELRRGFEASSCVGPGKSNHPFELRGRAGGCTRVTAGQKKPHPGLCLGPNVPLKGRQGTWGCIPDSPGSNYCFLTCIQICQEAGQVVCYSHFLLQGVFPTQGSDPGIEPRSPALEADTLTSEPPGKPPGHTLR